MKTSGKFLYGLLIVCILIASLFYSTDKKESAALTNPDSRQNITYENEEYSITQFRIEINVNEDNTFLITEYITAYFRTEKHGILRKLPLRNKVVRSDGSVSHNRAVITDIQVSGGQFSVSNEDGNRVIKIGDPESTLTGSKDYIISYAYNIGKDPVKDSDEFYFNLIGNEWDTEISGIEFKITMPKDFDESGLGFSSGPEGSEDSSNVSFSTDGNTITGRCSGTLNAGEGLTVRLQLPEGYFTGASSNFDMLMLAAIVLPVLFAVLTFIMWMRFGKDEKTIETVEFYPPAGFNSAEVGFLYKGKAETNDVVSLLIYLADKGYIGISEIYDGKPYSSKPKGFKLTKLKEYNGDNPNERLFLSGLFRARPAAEKATFAKTVSMMKNPQAPAEQAAYAAAGELSEVTADDLKNNFYTTLHAIVSDMNKKENKEQIFEKNSLNKNRFAVLMIISVFVLITFRPLTEYSDFFTLSFALIFPGVGFTVLFGALIGTIKMPKLFAVIWGGGFAAAPWAVLVLPALMMDQIYLLTYLSGLICIVIMLFFVKYMTRRTEYGNEMLGKIKGFRNFLLTSEKNRLEEMVMSDPSYFYSILPFTYVLGISDKWIRRFESIAVQAPDWYSGSAPFSTSDFGTFINSAMSSASSSMSSSPSSDSSGGGSSGGGSGGGGGGSW